MNPVVRFFKVEFPGVHTEATLIVGCADEAQLHTLRELNPFATGVLSPGGPMSRLLPTGYHSASVEGPRDEDDGYGPNEEHRVTFFSTWDGDFVMEAAMVASAYSSKLLAFRLSEEAKP